MVLPKIELVIFPLPHVVLVLLFSGFGVFFVVCKANFNVENQDCLCMHVHVCVCVCKCNTACPTRFLFVVAVGGSVVVNLYINYYIIIIHIYLFDCFHTVFEFDSLNTLIT